MDFAFGFQVGLVDSAFGFSTASFAIQRLNQRSTSELAHATGDAKRLFTNHLKTKDRAEHSAFEKA